MKRDLDLVMKILREVEKIPAADGGSRIDIPEFDAEVVAGHIELLRDAGFLEAFEGPDCSECRGIARAKRLTREGHDFIAVARDPAIWGEVKARIEKEGGAEASLNLIKWMLDKAARKRLLP
jgi:hypothetical protein